MSLKINQEMQIEICKAKVSDAQACFSLAKKLSLNQDKPSDEFESQGFVMGLDSLDEYRQLFASGNSVLAFCQGKAIAFVKVYLPGEDGFPSENSEALRNARIEGETLKCWINPVYIGMICVDPEYAGLQIGRKLYQEVANNFPSSTLFCSIAELPYSNTASRLFHEKCGFSRVGQFSADNFAGFDHYQSGIYKKILN